MEDVLSLVGEHTATVYNFAHTYDSIPCLVICLPGMQGDFPEVLNNCYS